MTSEAVITALRAHEPELKAAGVTRLTMFGSTARGEAQPDSDVDLLAAFDDTRALSLLDVIRIENLIADILGQPVDLVEEGTLKPEVRQRVDREVIVSEAATRLGSTAMNLQPDIPWRDIRGIGNRLRHGYETIDLGRIWLLIERDLAPLQGACEAALWTLSNGTASP